MELLQQIAEELSKWFNLGNIVAMVVALAVLSVLGALFSRRKKSPHREQPTGLEIDYGQKRIEKPEDWRDCLRVSGQS